MDIEFLNGSLNPKNIIDCIRYKRKFRKDHPEYFDPERSFGFLRFSRFW